MVEMSVAGLAIEASSQNPIVLLRDPSGRRQVPIWIDHAQAHNIMVGINPDNSQRPLSHDLMMALLKAGHLRLKKVIIHSIEANTFQAVLKLEQLPYKNKEESTENINLIELDARPSDAIALAIRSKCSIWMLENVVAEASIPVDADADAEDQNEFHEFINTLSPASLIKHLNEREDYDTNS